MMLSKKEFGATLQITYANAVRILLKNELSIGLFARLIPHVGTRLLSAAKNH